ncbi:MAG: bifunctional aldolase/short-chain dehydrogenase [Vicinamibacterales bacterium]
MINRWSDDEAAGFVAKYGDEWGEALALRTYTARLLGQEPSLVLHGGGNTSVKAMRPNVLGDLVPAIYVKASGRDLATIEPCDQPALDLERLLALETLGALGDEEMINQLRINLFRHDSGTPSIESLVHAFLKPRFIDHTHADAVLALTNQAGGLERVIEALGEKVIVLDYVRPGFALAKAASAAFGSTPGSTGMVWMHHGITTWGETARESYSSMIDLVTKAEEYLARRSSRPLRVFLSIPRPPSCERVQAVAPILRGLLSKPRAASEGLPPRVIVQAHASEDVVSLLDAPGARDLFVTPALTSDHLIRTKATPAWVEAPDFADPARLREQISRAVDRYASEYNAYLARHAASRPGSLAPFDPRPRVILVPGAGAFCAGPDAHAAAIARDITAHTLAVKWAVAGMGKYQGLAEEHLAAMEYHVQQHAKLARTEGTMAGRVALVTGAAGAIGYGIAERLLEEGCHVAVTDLPGEALEELGKEFAARFATRAIAVSMDVTDRWSVASGFAAVVSAWGGVDLVVANAGLAHVSPLEEMDVEKFRLLERVNVEGTLLVLAEAARHFRHQAAGGDVVLVSTKNVFAPGARFGAYSATKAAAHQLGRIASLELAELDVRVNMVSPDAVFGHGMRRSGLWKEVGPERMRARGLDEAGLEDYYRNRNLLKARVTARHVANAVLYFATRQSPTTGATIPVDGGLPDSTPR